MVSYLICVYLYINQDYNKDESKRIIISFIIMLRETINGKDGLDKSKRYCKDIKKNEG